MNACDSVTRKCITIADTMHGSAWLFDKMIRFFEANEACVSITIPVFIGLPVMSPGEATISRDGSLIIKRTGEA